MLTKAELRKLYKYDPKTGAFVYRTTRGKYKAGEPAGSVQVIISHRIKIGKVNHHLGPVIHRYMTGRKPKGVVDHKNGDRTDFRWSNLRDVSHQANAINAPRKASKTGYAGVVVVEDGRKKKYRAVIGHNYKQITIGYFYTAEEAGRAHLKKKRELHGKYLRQAKRG